MHSFDSMPCIDHLENIGSLSYSYLPNVAILHYTISNASLTSLISSETSLAIEQLSNSQWQIQVFQNSVIENLNFDNKYCWLLFLK